MSYPTLPFALVHYLANVSKQRAGLRKGPTHVSLYAHHDKGVSSTRFEVDRTNNDHWNEVLRGAIALWTSGPIDTFTLVYPTDDPRKDIGIIIERGRPPMVFEWTFDPAFTMVLVEHQDTLAQLMGGVAVAEIIGLMEKGPEIRLPAAAPAPSIPPALAADGGPSVNSAYG